MNSLSALRAGSFAHVILLVMIVSGVKCDFFPSFDDIRIMIGNFWNRILDWFEDRRDRAYLVRSFNKAAKSAFIAGAVPTLLTASVSKGDRSYRHQHSHWMYSGFRIVAFSGRQLSRPELKDVGLTVLQNPELSRQLVVLGFDTLEVQPNVGQFGLKWELRDHMMIG